MAKKCCRSDPPCKHCPKRKRGQKAGNCANAGPGASGVAPAAGPCFVLLHKI